VTHGLAHWWSAVGGVLEAVLTTWAINEAMTMMIYTLEKAGGMNKSPPPPSFNTSIDG
jgi:hypothetical protein